MAQRCRWNVSGFDQPSRLTNGSPSASPGRATSSRPARSSRGCARAPLRFERGKGDRRLVQERVGGLQHARPIVRRDVHNRRRRLRTTGRRRRSHTPPAMAMPQMTLAMDVIGLLPACIARPRGRLGGQTSRHYIHDTGRLTGRRAGCVLCWFSHSSQFSGSFIGQSNLQNRFHGLRTAARSRRGSGHDAVSSRTNMEASMKRALSAVVIALLAPRPLPHRTAGGPLQREVPGRVGAIERHGSVLGG